jgi:hypothetical protein
MKDPVNYLILIYIALFVSFVTTTLILTGFFN